MLGVVLDEAQIEGGVEEGQRGGGQVAQSGEEEIKAEMKAIKVGEGLSEGIAQLNKQADALISQLKAEIESSKQFTIDFPDLYVLESD